MAERVMTAAFSSVALQDLSHSLRQRSVFGHPKRGHSIEAKQLTILAPWAGSATFHMTITKMPCAPSRIEMPESPPRDDIDDFVFEGGGQKTPARDLTSSNILDDQRNGVLVGGTGTGETHRAITIVHACIHSRLCGLTRAVLPSLRARRHRSRQ